MTVLIDGSHLLYRCWNTPAGKELKTKAGIPTGVIHGVLSSLCSIIKTLEPQEIIIVWDRKSQHRNKRITEYRTKLEAEGTAFSIKALDDAPLTYKGSRVQSYTEDDKNAQRDILFPQKEALTYIIPHLGIRQFIIDGVEGDDLLGILSDRVCTSGKVVIVSSDKDLFQLLGDNVEIYDPIKKKRHTEESFTKAYGVLTDQWAEVKALCGDKNDDIPGVPRIGEKTAIKLIKEHGGIVNLFKNSAKDPKLSKIEDYKDQVRLAYDLSCILAIDELNPSQRAQFEQAYESLNPINWDEILTFTESYELDYVWGELKKVLGGFVDSRDLRNAKTVDELFKLWGECARCPLSQTRVKLVRYSGPPTAKIMLLGEAPGPTENLFGIPFIGKAGQYLTDKCLTPNGLRREDLHITNIVLCFPQDNQGDIRAPSKEEVAACSPRLKAHIKLVNPKVVVLLGDSALKSLYPNSGKISDERGICLTHPEYPDIFFVAIFHPSFLMRLTPTHSAVIKSRQDWAFIKQIADST